MHRNECSVNEGMSHHSAEYAMEALRRQQGQQQQSEPRLAKSED